MKHLDRFPKTRAECLLRKEVCPWIRCKHHMIWWHYKAVPHLTDQQILNWIDSRVVHCDCVLDIIDYYGTLTYDEIGEALDINREIPRQIELLAIRKLNKRLKDTEVRGMLL